MRFRESARAILLDDRDRVLLFEYEDHRPIDPANPQLLRYWLTPGGGLKGGESFHEALLRELEEELGFQDVAVGPLIGIREIVLDLYSEGLVLSHERYYACRLHSDQPVRHDGFSDNERRVFRSVHWWTVAEIFASEGPLRPPALPELVRIALHADETTIVVRMDD